MPKELLFEIVTLIVCLAIAVISLILYLGEYRRRREEKSLSLVNRIMQKAQTIIGTKDKIAAKFAESSLEKEMSLQMNKAYSDYVKFLEGLKEHDTEIQTTNQEIIKQRVDAIFDKFEQNLGTFLTSTEQKSVQSIELELRAARQLIETYKTQQMAIIDENVISILERTLTLVLAKKIPLKDQVDLIYEALNKAKVEKFIV